MDSGTFTRSACAAAGAITRWLIACALLVVPWVSTLAQEGGLDAAIEQGQQSAVARDLKAQASAEAPKTDDRHELGIFYHKRGVANRRLGDFARAIDDLRLALENIQPKRPTPDGWGQRARIQAALAVAYANAGNRLAAIEAWNVLAGESIESNPYGYFAAQSQLVFNYTQVGRWAQAEAARQAAAATLPVLRATRSWMTEGPATLTRESYTSGVFFRERGEFPAAEREFRAAREHAQESVALRRRTDPPGHPRIGDAQEMLAVVRAELSGVLVAQGKYGEAEASARTALVEALNLGGFSFNPVSSALWGLARLRLQQGDLAGSEKYYRYALVSAEGSASPAHSTRVAGGRAGLANALLVQGRWDEALALFEERDRGLRSDAAQFKRTGSNHVSWAYALHKTGQSQRAAQMAGLMASNQAKRAVPDRWYVAQLRGVAGVALAATGKTAEALQAFQQSIPELVRRDQDDGGTENTGYWRVYWQRVILECYLELLAKLHVSRGVSGHADFLNESFRIADIARGSSVQEAINVAAARGRIRDRSLADAARQQDALNRVVALNQLLARLASGPPDERLYKAIADMRAEIERMRAEYSALRADIRDRYPEYAELIDPRPVEIANIQKALVPGEALVSIYIGDSQSYVWTIAGARVAVRVVQVKRDEIESDVRELRKSVDLGDGSAARLRPFDLVRAYKLYRLFLEPDEALWRDARLLNIVPHGALAQVPLALLVTAAPSGAGETAYNNAPWLIRKVAIAQLPSASAFTVLRRAPAGKPQRQAFIGFGDPLFTADAGAKAGAVRSLLVRREADQTDALLQSALRGGGANKTAAVPSGLSQAFYLLSPLPDTGSELRDIATVLSADPVRDVFVNRQATEKNVKQTGLDNRRVVAFATHGIAPGEIIGLDQPALVLSNPALTGDTDNDGFLTMEEILALKLDADWVVLSACNTASADGRGSEAVSGLGRAFFYAGARSLLVSNWAVETTSARLLTTELFKRQAENPQLTRAEALRQSMLDLMGKKGPGGFSYAHPAFWAPFSLVGDGGR